MVTVRGSPGLSNRYAADPGLAERQGQPPRPGLVSGRRPSLPQWLRPYSTRDCASQLLGHEMTT